ncbi:DUF2332 domain-containing protein [Amycolatopsis jejuensis]|uniref:DUF2332 domain-containing protein n=1 Tax=Amycolatopsis jejuensis TaxID=330084 RepID=UPI000527DDB7|nr:DUF2332 domain-containing protein [Amycolatopsis jejuensis]
MTRTLAQTYRRFGEDATSPWYQRVSLALSESPEALRAIETAPARKRHPTVILAALHDLALSGRAPADDAVDTVLQRTDEVVAIAVRRPLRTGETGRATVLYPLIAEVAHRAGADAVGLLDFGCSAGFNLTVDRVGITYSKGEPLGDPASPVQVSASIVGDRPLPPRAIPEVVARIGLDTQPLDMTDAADARWLRACLPPDQPERIARLDAEIALTATVSPTLEQGDPVDLLPDALAQIPVDALPVVTTTWALSRLSVERRRRFASHLAEAGRTVAWVSAEGVGVAPEVPTFGDRPASGHSILGVALADGSGLRTEAVGRCWSRGRLLSWLATGPLWTAAG